jgi:phage I-like protein
MQTATLSQQLVNASTEMRILPDGVFRATDGRPDGLPGWKINASSAPRVISASLASGKDILIDYEHQSMHAAKNGQPVPAAGWFNRLEWRSGLGMFAVGIQWNDKAKSMIAAREYRYVSPVFSFDHKTGDVLQILSVAITNNPALPSLTDFGKIAANSANARYSNRLCDQRGMEALRQLDEYNAAMSAIYARSTVNSQSGNAKPKHVATFIDDGDPRNQRGLEILRRMAEM